MKALSVRQPWALEINDGIKFSVRSCIREVQASELASFLANDIGNGGGLMARPAAYGDWPEYLSLTLPPLAAVALTPEG